MQTEEPIVPLESIWTELNSGITYEEIKNINEIIQ